MKIGFDIHGVIDSFTVFPNLVNAMIEDESYEVHIVTGLSRKEADKEIGHMVDLSKVKYFSIADYLESRDDVEVTWDENGLPWADIDEWNNSKARYCEEEGIDILFDDSPTYVPTFENIDTIYCQIHNPNRKTFR